MEIKTMDTNNPSPLQLAVQLLGGAIKPTAEALRKLGWPKCSKQAIALRRRLGTLPVPEIKIGREYFITAPAVVGALLTQPGAGERPEPEANRPVARKRGRPPKVAPTPIQNRPASPGDNSGESATHGAQQPPRNEE